MINHNRLYSIVAVVVLLSSCFFHPDRQRQNWLGQLERTHVADNQQLVRVYFDKWGNIYSDAVTVIPSKNFFDPYHTGRVTKEKIATGSLEHYYTANPAELRSLAVHYGLAGSFANGADSFYAVQKIIYQQNGNEITKMLNATTAKTLVVMVHGFNDPDPTGDYQQLRDLITAQHDPGKNYIYLEVFWDGLTANGANPAFSHIWGRSQQNSAYVGLGLRELLNRLATDIKIRIVTHSLGASVGTGALFNTLTKWNAVDANKPGAEYPGWDFPKLTTLIPAPRQTDIRIGMIAPAIPGKTTFKDFDQRNWVCSPATNNINRIVVGYNKNDYAVTKRFWRYDLAPSHGATSLGCNWHNEVGHTLAVLQALHYNGDILQSVNFTMLGPGETEEHGLYYYCLNPHMPEFLDWLFKN